MTLFISIQLHFGCYNLKNLIIELQTYRKLRKVSRVLELIVYQRFKKTSLFCTHLPKCEIKKLLKIQKLKFLCFSRIIFFLILSHLFGS